MTFEEWRETDSGYDTTLDAIYKINRGEEASLEGLLYKEYLKENNMRAPRIYTITRQDLSLGQKIVQSNHASTQYLIDHSPHKKGEWNNGSIICLELGNEKSLKRWIKKLEAQGIKYSLFREPDLDHAITAIAILHQGDIFKGIPLIK